MSTLSCKGPRRRSALSLAFYLFCSSAGAQDGLTSVTVEGTAKAESAAEAAKTIVQNLTASVARQHVLEIVGEKAFQKNKSLIENRIIKEAYKFIPFVTPGVPVSGASGWRMSVELKVAVDSLRQMIIDNGLLFDTEGPAAILPMVAVVDRVRGQEYRWWTARREEASSKFSRQLSQDLHQALFDTLKRKGFYLVRPGTIDLIGVLPESVRGERTRQDDFRFLGDFFRAQMLVRGDLRLRESTEISGGYQIGIKLSAVQATNGRAVAEVTRTFETDRGPIESVVRAKLQSILSDVTKDLSAQIVDAWEKGTLGSNLLKLSLKGRLNPKQWTEFKTQLLKHTREIKSVRERLIEADGMTFDVDYAGQAQQFSERMKALSLPGFALKLSDSSKTGVTVEIKAL